MRLCEGALAKTLCRGGKSGQGRMQTGKMLLLAGETLISVLGFRKSHLNIPKPGRNMLGAFLAELSSDRFPGNAGS